MFATKRVPHWDIKVKINVFTLIRELFANCSPVFIPTLLEARTQVILRDMDSQPAEKDQGGTYMPWSYEVSCAVVFACRCASYSRARQMSPTPT